MSLPLPSPGEVLAGRFRINRFIASGGMGHVFEALDLEVRERVAVKVVRPELLADEQGRTLFLREVQTARKVTHPNVCRTYDVFRHQPIPEPGKEGAMPETTFLSMELLEGETLASRIARGKFTPEEALPLLRQIAAALAAAHEAGIVHRDIKPRNVILVGAAGILRAVVTDFGLARTASGETTQLTAPGAMPGTPAYMAPEQIDPAGQITPAVDIYGLGLVLYEMVSGRRPFEADNPLKEALARLTEKPRPLRVHVSDIDPRWEAAILRCLERNPDDRFRNPLDVVRAITGDKGERGPRVRRALFWRLAFAAAFLATTALIAVRLLQRQPPAPPSLPDIGRLNFDPGVALQAAISPDGKLTAYVSDTGGNFDIWIQQTGGRLPVRLTHHEAMDWMPSFSPDGSQIAFRSERDGGGIYIVESLGGQERKIADRGMFPRFSPDGLTISYCESGAWYQPSFNRMFLIGARGGTPRSFQPEFGGADWPLTSGPVWSPDGKHLLFAGQRGKEPATWEWYVAPAEGGKAVATGILSVLQKRFQTGIYAPSGWCGDFVYFSAGSSPQGVDIYRLRLKPGSWEAEGPPEQITSGPGVRSQASVALDGRIVFATVNVNYDLHRLALNTVSGGAVDESERLGLDATVKREPSMTHDDLKLLYSAYAGGEEPAKLELRLRDLLRGTETVLFPTGNTFTTYPRVSADGSAVAYSDYVDGERRSYLVEGNAGTPREICRGCRTWAFFNSSRDVIIREQSGKPQKLNLATGRTSDLLVPTDSRVLDLSLSWDDTRLVVHAGRPDGTAALYIVPVRDVPVPESEWQLIVQSRRWLGVPRWAPEGGLVYFLAEFDGMCCLYAQRLNRGGAGGPAGPPLAVFHAHRKPHLMVGFRGSLSFDVARHFIVLTITDLSGTVWTTRLRD